MYRKSSYANLFFLWLLLLFLLLLLIFRKNKYTKTSEKKKQEENNLHNLIVEFIRNSQTYVRSDSRI